MTALQEYQRLESTGLWRATPEDQRREVVVSFGDATLVIADPRGGHALTHWSLPAVVRLNPARRPALYAPAADAGEELEIDDEAMIAALSKTQRIIAARRPHPGRLRAGLTTTFLAGLAGLGFLWLPGALIDHTADALPPAKTHEIGTAALDDLARLTGAPCDAPEGTAVLARLATALLGDGGRIAVLPQALDQVTALPGTLVVVPRDRLETAAGPEPLLAAIAAAAPPPGRRDSTREALRYAGLMATLNLLTSGELPAGALKGFGERLLRRPAEDPAPATDRTLGAVAIGDADWVALQSICAN
ncbi:MAG: hypothetical protein H6895_05620 [Defluviimonas sp.]|uniref:hypothetical protein n=1 Tax=Albidovulum sp. TaxID=1872424 RepID=UPI001D35C9C9|nr:hypothetical protein [Paracoccaceae bacterium]MCC0063556.1 hypothetical protein [Defluviimonas sp.]